MTPDVPRASLGTAPGPRLLPQSPGLILAPMEGVTCAAMRALLTEAGGLSLCVAEFLRISQEVPPSTTFLRHMPECATGGATASGVPVVFQLLGGDADRLARAATMACRLGAPAIDLNFGCPARTVNRHDGGAALLRAPERLRDIVHAVRTAVPPHISVSAKLRLGWEDTGCIHANADAVAEAGAAFVTIHGRTRVQGYRPWAYWRPIAQVQQRLPIPVVANGDIFSIEDLLRCQAVTGCAHFMVGRGAVARPGWLLHAAWALRYGAASPYLGAASHRALLDSELQPEPVAWGRWMRRFVRLTQEFGQTPQALPGRLKQWACMAHRLAHMSSFDAIKRLRTTEEILQAADAH